MDRKIFLVIQVHSFPDCGGGNDETSIELGFTIASCLAEAKDKYPSKPYGARTTVLGPDEFFEFSIKD